jgi:DNA polymerase
MRDIEIIVADSLISWWADAGLIDAVQDDPAIWLSAPTTAAVVEPARSAASPASRPTAVAPAPIVFPNNLAAFDAWLKDAPHVPGGSWSAARILPTGAAQARLMVIADMPDVSDLTANHLLAGEVGVLFDAMLAAIHLNRSMLRLASIAITRPVGATWDEETATALRAMTLHHITLAQPQRLLLLGQTTCHLLSGENVPADGQGLRNINHYGGTTAAVAIHHPRTLLRQPSLKRAAWTALKQLRESA